VTRKESEAIWDAIFERNHGAAAREYYKLRCPVRSSAQACMDEGNEGRSYYAFDLPANADMPFRRTTVEFPDAISHPSDAEQPSELI
jgi:hypothetical protein